MRSSSRPWRMRRPRAPFGAWRMRFWPRAPLAVGLSADFCCCIGNALAVSRTGARLGPNPVERHDPRHTTRNHHDHTTPTPTSHPPTSTSPTCFPSGAGGRAVHAALRGGGGLAAGAAAGARDDRGRGQRSGCHLLSARRHVPKARVVAVDGAGPLLEAALARAARLGIADRFSTLEAELGDGLGDLEYPADLLWASRSLHHVGDQRAALAGFAERLAPGGTLAPAGGRPALALTFRATSASAARSAAPDGRGRAGVVHADAARVARTRSRRPRTGPVC